MFGKTRYITPGGRIYNVYDDMASKPHLLIAGATGSGKSVIENGIIYNILHKGPSQAGLILIDPKKVELIQYASVPHTIKYASTDKDIINALQLAENISNNRFSEMQKRKIRMYDGSDIYVIIDELAHLMSSLKAETLPILKRLAMVSRASKIHIIALTQTVKADILPTTLTCNFDNRVALRTSTAQQSRMIIDVPGCETFPDPSTAGRGLMYYRNGANLTLYNVPKYPDEWLDDIVNYWTTKRCIA